MSHCPIVCKCHATSNAADKRRPAKPLEIDVQGEVASALSMAYDSNWSLARLEDGIKEHKGNFEEIFREVSRLGSCSIINGTL